MTASLFAEHLLSSVLALHEDIVPNTRIVLARLLTEHVLKSRKYQLIVFSVLYLNTFISHVKLVVCMFTFIVILYKRKLH